MLHYDSIEIDGKWYGRTWTDDAEHKTLVRIQTGEVVGEYIMELLPHPYSYTEVDQDSEDRGDWPWVWH